MDTTKGPPQLRAISLDDISQLGALPIARIKTDDDVERWKNRRCYHDYMIFLRRLNESVVGCFLPWNPEKHSQVYCPFNSIASTLKSLSQ